MGAFILQSLDLPHSQSLLLPTKSKVLWTTDRDDIRQQTSKYCCLVGLYCSPLKMW